MATKSNLFCRINLKSESRALALQKTRAPELPGPVAFAEAGENLVLANLGRLKRLNRTTDRIVEQR